MTATPSQALRALAKGSSCEERRTAAIALAGPLVAKLTLQTPAALKRLAIVLEDAWRDTRAPRAEFVAGLMKAVRTDEDVLTMQVAAAALALEGEDGVTELLTLGTHDEFAIRNTVAIALSLLGRSARWAVPTLIRFMDREPLEYVRQHVTTTLGQIGGREAIAKLEELLWDAQGGGSWEDAAVIRATLEEARLLDLLADRAEAEEGVGGDRAAPGHRFTGDLSAAGAGVVDDEAEADGGDEEEDEDREEEDPWRAISGADVAEAINRALIKDQDAAPPATVFKPIREVSLRSMLLAVLPGDKDTQARAGEWLDNTGIEQTFFRVADTSPQGVVNCCVSSSMVSGCWGVSEFRLSDRCYLYYSPDEGEHELILGAWEPAEDAAARQSYILSVYAREWRELTLPPAMGEWATAEPGLLQEAILRVLEAEPDAWEAVLRRLRGAPEPRDASTETVEEIAAGSASFPQYVRDLLDLVAAQDEELAARLARGLSSDEERRVVVALFVHCIAKNPFRS